MMAKLYRFWIAMLTLKLGSGRLAVKEVAR